MDKLRWFLLILSAVLFLLGIFTRLIDRQVLQMDPGTFWKGAMSLVAYAMALRLFQLRST